MGRSTCDNDAALGFWMRQWRKAAVSGYPWAVQLCPPTRCLLDSFLNKIFYLVPRMGIAARMPNRWDACTTLHRACIYQCTLHLTSCDSIFGLVNSTYFLKITNHNQHAFNIKYLANLIKKCWTCFRFPKLADFLVCFPPSVRVQVQWPPSWKICLRIQLSFDFWGRAVKALDNFSWMTIEDNILEILVDWFVSPDSPNWRYRQNYNENNWQVWIREAFLGRILASPGAMDGWHCWQNISNL